MSDSHQSETYKSLIQISVEGFRYLALMNGATWLTVLTFSERGVSGQPEDCSIKVAVALFIVSLTLTALCYLGSWLTQLCLHNENVAKASQGSYVFPEGRHILPMWLTILVFVTAVSVYFVAAVIALIVM